MAHNIPKISYGGIIPTDIAFTYPPSVGMARGSTQLNRKSTQSLSGVTQVQLNYIEEVRKFTFSFLTDAQIDALTTFVTTWAAFGKTFNYFENKNALDYVTYQYDQEKLEPKIIAPRGANVYLYSVEMQFSRVLGAVGGTGYMLTTILNNQATPVALDGLILNYSLYYSARVFFEIHRKTSAEERSANGEFTCVYTAATGWQISQGNITQAGNDTGVIFSIDTATGQVYYTSDLMSGTSYVGTVALRNFTIIGG